MGNYFSLLGGLLLDTALKLKIVESVNSLQGKEFLSAVISLGAAPTIKGKKPASLLTFTVQRKNLLSLWQLHKEEICDILNLAYFELKYREKSVTVLFYNRAILENHVAGERNKDFLNKAGYLETFSLEQKLQLLKERYNCSCPHEVGIFLGIPVEDVEGFIKHKGKNSLLCRYWKVYQDQRRAELLFNIYDRAKMSIASEIFHSCHD